MTTTAAGAGSASSATAGPPPRRPVRIANVSGFLGDRTSALAEMVQGGAIDFVTGDYLAELTMMILGKQQAKDPRAGYAAPFLAQIAPVLGTILERGIKVVVNAGGLNPEGLAAALTELAAKSGLAPKIATIHGDDLRGRLPELLRAGHPFVNLDTGEPLTEAVVGAVLTSNAYLGGWGIAKALDEGADIVLCPRVTDASLVVGVAAHWFGWARDEWDRLAGAVVAGHVIECGAQATGGNYSSFQTIADLDYPGFPLAEIADDGSAVITKHEGTGGAVTVGTVTAQLVYEIASTRYENPDVATFLDTVTLVADGPNRVRLLGTRGAPPPATTKVATTTRGFFRNELTFVFVGLSIPEKMALFERTTRALLAKARGIRLTFQRIGSPNLAGSTQDEATALLRVVATGTDEKLLARAFSAALIEQGLTSYPGLFALGLPSGAIEVGGYWPALLPQSELRHIVKLADGTEHLIPLPPAFSEPGEGARPDEASAPWTEEPMVEVPLGRLCDARSGDKGDNANVGIWARDDETFAFLRQTLTVEKLRALLPEAGDRRIERCVLPGLRALNFVLHGYLGGGAAASAKLDRQGKALGEFVRSRTLSVPARLVGVGDGA
jgi:hypothetical protein